MECLRGLDESLELISSITFSFLDLGDGVVDRLESLLLFKKILAKSLGGLEFNGRGSDSLKCEPSFGVVGGVVVAEDNENNFVGM